MLPASDALGVNVAVLPDTPTVPLTGVPLLVTTSVNVAVVSVALFIGSENIAANAELSAMPVAPFNGEVDSTVGGVVSGAAAVVNDQLTFDASALPATSRAPVVMVAVNCVLPASDAFGVKVAVLPDTPTEPLTGVPLLVTTKVNVAVVSVALFIGSENMAANAEVSATPVAPLSGDVESTVGGVVSGGAVVVNDQV